MSRHSVLICRRSITSIDFNNLWFRYIWIIKYKKEKPTLVAEATKKHSSYWNWVCRLCLSPRKTERLFVVHALKSRCVHSSSSFRHFQTQFCDAWIRIEASTNRVREVCLFSVPLLPHHKTKECFNMRPNTRLHLLFFHKKSKMKRHETGEKRLHKRQVRQVKRHIEMRPNADDDMQKVMSASHTAFTQAARAERKKHKSRWGKEISSERKENVSQTLLFLAFHFPRRRFVVSFYVLLPFSCLFQCFHQNHLMPLKSF